jgi:LacI family transcriptional regulator
MEKVAKQRGYQLLISQSEESVSLEAENILALFNSRVDGFPVSLSNETKYLDYFRNVFRKDIPILFFDRVFCQSNCICVVIDNFKAGYEATQHLIDQGCRKIACVTGSPNRNVYNDRLRGYKSAVSTICELKKAGYRIPEDIAVVGFNDDPVSKVVEPSLTTVHYPGREMGEIAASSMINILEGIQIEKINTIILNSELTVQQSSDRSLNNRIEPDKDR